MDTQSWLWPGVKDFFLDDLNRLYERCGPWDLVLFTGDITQHGLPDEFDRSLRHTGPGILSMANRNPYDRMTQKPIYDEKTGLTVGNTGSAQFFVTVAKTEALDDRHTIFGRCDTKVPVAISQVRTQSRPIPDKPFEDVTIETVDIVRKK